MSRWQRMSGPELLAPPQVTRWARSPHQSSRQGAAVRYVILHADVAPRESATVSWLTSPASGVSYHVLIHRDGTMTRFVSDDRAAWACGASEWRGLRWLNRHSVSLAFSNRHDGTEPLTDAQMARARAQIAAWRGAYSIDAVLTHAQISPGRKTDPDQIPNFKLTDYA